MAASRFVVTRTLAACEAVISAGSILPSSPCRARRGHASIGNVHQRRPTSVHRSALDLPASRPVRVLGERGCVEQRFKEFATRRWDKLSIADLIKVANLPTLQRVEWQFDALKVGLARCGTLLQDMPHGFGNMPSIRSLADLHHRSFAQLMEFEQHVNVSDPTITRYCELQNRIFEEHAGAMQHVSAGMAEFVEATAHGAGSGVDVCDLHFVKDVEDALDSFLTARLTLRLLLSHAQALDDKKTAAATDDVVGIVNMNTKPLSVLSSAYSLAQMLCHRKLAMFPGIMVNGKLYDEHTIQSSETSDPDGGEGFPYVDSHLLYIFLELTKNSARASVERAVASASRGRSGRDSAEVPPLQVTMPDTRTIKLVDEGHGMSAAELRRAVRYFYTSAASRPDVHDHSADPPIAGFGFGLPMSRVIARYFEGDVHLISELGRGTDAWVRL